MSEKKTQARNFIILMSILIPILVGILYLIPGAENVSEDWKPILNNLPKSNSIINGTTFFVLIAAVVAIRTGKVTLHKRLMLLSLFLSIVFLMSYVTYHYTAEETKFGGEGTVKIIYQIILATHIVLSIVLVPLVLISFVRALSERFDKHKKIARITMPIWLYVTMSGVIVYMMISPYYPFNL